jgi:hypothetical protein
MARPCCAERPDGRQLRSPFSRVVATGFYDGATEGFTECDTCRTLYEFSMLEWDEGQDVRLFKMEEKAGGLFDELVEMVRSNQQQPRWPIWVPRFPLPDAAEKRIQEHHTRAAGARFLIATENPTKTILVWRHLGRDEIVDGRHDLLKALGVARSKT